MDATVRRRWFGALVLFTAVGLLVAGDTVLKGRLGTFGFLAYWLVCLALTGVAILVAMIDFRAERNRIRNEQVRLFESTLKQIQADAEERPKSEGRRPEKSKAQP